MPVLSDNVDQQCHGKSGTQVTHVIFDVDGTLLDTGPLYNKAITKVNSMSADISEYFSESLPKPERIKRGALKRPPKSIYRSSSDDHDEYTAFIKIILFFPQFFRLFPPTGVLARRTSHPRSGLSWQVPTSR